MSSQVPLLLLPGLMNDDRIWKPIQDALPTGRTIGVSPTHQVSEISELAVRAIKSMPSGSFAVGGFSLGGFVALEVCRQVPERVAGLALLDTSARADSDEARASRQKMVDAIASGKSSFAQVAGAFAPRLLHPTHAEGPSILQVLTDMARRIGAAGFARQQAAAMSRQDSRELLKTIRCPALVICGEQDQITPPSLSAETAQLLAGHVDLVQIPECGHMSTLEQPVAVTTAFMKWLRLVDA